jgi:aminomethyltransferase
VWASARDGVRSIRFLGCLKELWMSEITPSPIDVSPALTRTPLHRLHQKLGARMVGFGGYEMPLNYPTGIIAEHLHTRAEAGLFDVSHMGQASLEGSHAALRLESLVPGDIQNLTPGRMRYTQLLDHDGNILDDLMVTRLEDKGPCERLLIVVNAGTKARDFAYIASNLTDLALTIFSDRTLIALQGPRAADVLGRHVPDVATMPFLSWRHVQNQAFDGFVSRSGYTGEDGFEISVPTDQAQRFAELLLGEPEVRPIGLGARDSLRLEAGLCLYGHDIDTATNPIEAGLGWSISKRRRFEGGFLGAKRLQQILEKGYTRQRVGLLVDGQVPARAGSQITTCEDNIVGQVTSGSFAPSLGRPIAMGYVAVGQTRPGTPLRVFVRGKSLTAAVTPMPFMPHRYYRGS